MPTVADKGIDKKRIKEYREKKNNNEKNNKSGETRK